MNQSNVNTILETDYLVVGCGAVGMAFTDIILSETDAHVIIVDRFDKPGGHWNLSYPFVRLHQPASYYGISSVDLGKNGMDSVGLNKGLYHLSSGAEIRAYYDDIMQHRFLPGGRVKYFPLCDYVGEGKFVSILTGLSYQVRVNKKIVNAAHMQTKVPSAHTPNFKVAKGIRFIPINDLPRIKETPAGWVVIGGGKTGVDAILWLLEHKVDPSTIKWIVPRDAWFTDRKNTQPNKELLKHFLNDQAAQFEALENAESITDLFDRLERAGVLLRIDKDIKPKMFHGATVTQLEIEQLRRIKYIVRKGRVRSIDDNEILLEEGTIANQPDQIFVDCSASALNHSKIRPVFEGNTITLQPIRGAQIVFSAALIAHIESTFTDENQKNELCRVVPLPNHDTDWIKMLAGSMRNQHLWNQNTQLRKWLYLNRLDGFSHLMANVSEDDEELQAILKRMRKSIKPAVLKLKKFVSELS